MMKDHPLRIFYAAGPGNVAGTFRHWKAGRDDPSQVSVTHSSQFFNICRELGASALVVSSSAVPDREEDDQFLIEHRPRILLRAHGAVYHLAQVIAALQTVWRARRFGAQVAVISNGEGHWFVMRLLPLLGTAIIPSIHCVLWAKYRRPTRVQRIIRWLDGRFFACSAAAILSMSRDIEQQIDKITGGRHGPIIPFLPNYRRDAFADMPPPPAQAAPFRVFYAGRIEANKGVFDLLEIARQFRAEGRTQIEFDLAGTGSALDALRESAQNSNLSEVFRCHGHCNRDHMRELFAQSHVVIVPTRTDFIEGFNQVVAEGVLAGRPVITSAVCPALHYVRAAAVEVAPDDVAGYAQAILRLAEDRAYYRSLVEAARHAGDAMYDQQQGWEAALRRALAHAGVNAAAAQPQRPLPRSLAASEERA